MLRNDTDSGASEGGFGDVADLSALSPARRKSNLARVQREVFDVVVVGGGVVGAGVALDASSRGLSTVLFEARDFGSGTSSRSSKLIHGGLRYLEMLDFRLVREALRERTLLTKKIAPHLVRPVEFLFPLRSRYERAYVGAGVALYDILATIGGRRTHIPRHRHLNRAAALRKFPALKADRLSGAVTYYDAQVDDARFVVALIRTAATFGAVPVSRCEVSGLRRNDGVSEVDVHDRESGNTFTVRARNVVNAAGVWSNDIPGVGASNHNIRASKGVHIVVPRDRIEGDSAVITRAGKSIMLILPWGESEDWIIGTTDTDWKYDKAHPSATRSDIEYLLHEANEWLRKPLAREDVMGVYVGLRPLLAGQASSTTKLSREHVVEQNTDGVISIRGGKYTTYRIMAEDAVNMLTDVKSKTRTIPLVGATNEPGDIPQRLWLRYGSSAKIVLNLAKQRPNLAGAVDSANGHIGAEFVYAASHEGALHLEDLLTRRTHVSVTTKDRGVVAARPVAEVVAGVLGWDQSRIDHEVDTYCERVAAEIRSQEKDDDSSADAMRTAAPEVV